MASASRVMLGLTMPEKLGELALIERIRDGGASSRSSRGLVLGIGDDCAILRPPPGHEVLVTTDFSLENRHFRRDWHTPESVGHRALARGLSDLAAMGARPLGAFLSLALPPQMLTTRKGRGWVDRFFIGLRRLAEQSGVPLAGGDTSSSPTSLVLADIVLVGSAPAGRALRRSTARPGDTIYVTGSLGGAAAELLALAKTARRATENSAHHPQLFPQPRLAVGQSLLRRCLATSCIDLSDGLSTDLTHLCRESSVGAEIDAQALPVHSLAQPHGAKALDLALNGGEDYELLFTASASTRMPRSIAGIPITRIGTVMPGRSISLIQPDRKRRRLQPGGWEHFTAKH